jgi:hypothetical protein
MHTRIPGPAATLCLLAGIAVAGAPAMAAPPDPPVAGRQRAEGITVRQVAPDVSLRTRVADPALLQASRRFDALDANADGVLDPDEAEAGTFDRLDADGNGRIDRDEYTAQARR